VKQSLYTAITGVAHSRTIRDEPTFTVCDETDVSSAPQLDEKEYTMEDSAANPRYYVVDDNCNVVLVGSTPNDLVPAQPREERLPLDVDHAVRKLVTSDAFGAGPARATTGSKSLRVLLLSGPAGNFYGVVSRDRTRIARKRAS
jgi:hypothetical protein